MLCDSLTFQVPPSVAFYMAMMLQYGIFGLSFSLVYKLLLFIDK